VAAAIHLRRFTTRPYPTTKDLLSLELFDTVSPKDIGRLVLVGTDDHGNEIYVLGCGKYPQIMLKALDGFTRLLGGDPTEYYLVDVLPQVNLFMRIGGFLSRQLGWVSLGRPTVTFGTKRAIPGIRKLVQTTLLDLHQHGR
jgi:hypothetical protein